MPPRAWAQHLAEALDLPFHRLAQEGATTPWMAEHLLGRLRPEGYALACVHAGTNDVRSPDWDPGAYAAALDAILAAVVAASRRTCVATVPLDLGRPRAGAKVAELGAIVRRLAAARGAVVVDLDDLRGWRMLFPDAVHPTALGQLEIARRAAQALDAPVTLPVEDRGWRADLRYGLGRQVAHLWRDGRRRAREGAGRVLGESRVAP